MSILGEINKMALEMKLDSMDGVPDELKGFYVEKDGAFLLSVRGAVSDDSVQVMRNTIANVKAEKEQLRLDREAADLKAADAEKQRLLDAGEHEKLAAKLGEELAALKAANERSKQEKLESDKKAKAFDVAKVLGNNASAIDILSKLIDLELTYNESGELVSKEGETIEKMQERIKTCGQYDALLIGSRASGANLHSAGSSGHKKLSDMTGSEEVAFAKSNPEEYTEMLKKQV